MERKSNLRHHLLSLYIKICNESEWRCHFVIQLYISGTTRHGMITGFKVYHGLEKSRFQNHNFFLLYSSCGMCSFYVSSKTESTGVECSEERTSHTAPPPPAAVRLQAVSVSESHLCLCRMIAEGDESLELSPPSKNTKSAIWEFFW